MLPRLLLLLPLLLGVRADEDLSESELLDKALRFYASDDVAFLASTRAMLPSFVLLARLQLELAENVSAVESGLVRKFAAFNARLAQRSEAFRRIARAVDGGDTHLKLLGAMRVMAEAERRRLSLLASGDPTDLELVDKFDDAFDSGMVVVTDALFAALYNPHGKGDQLLAAGIAGLHRHPRLSLLFMRGCVELLLHAFVLEATHLQLTDAAEAARRAFDQRAAQRLALVLGSVSAARRRLGQDIGGQIRRDQRRFHEQLAGREHCDFAQQLLWYLRDKYPRLACFVHSYAPVVGWDSHAVSTYGSALFRVGRRNSVVDCRAASRLRPAFSRLARRALDAVGPQRRASERYAGAILEAVRAKLNEASVGGVTVTVVRAHAQGCYQGPFGHVVAGPKATYKCNTKLCWMKKSYDFNVALFG